MSRVTSVALIPLTLWFIWSVLHLTGATRYDVADWLSGPVNMALMLALIVATFHHMASGLQVVIEDYVHKEEVKVPSLLAVKGLCILLALICVVATLKVGL